MSSRMLIPERGLRDNRRNRRWLVLMRYLDERGLVKDQGKQEAVAWEIIKLLEAAR